MLFFFISIYIIPTDSLEMRYLKFVVKGCQMYKYSVNLKMNTLTVVMSMTQFPWTKVKYLKKSVQTIRDCCIITEDPSHLAANV